MTSIFLQLRKSQNVLNFCSHLFENLLRYINIVKKIIDSENITVKIRALIN